MYLTPSRLRSSMMIIRARWQSSLCNWRWKPQPLECMINDCADAKCHESSHYSQDRYMLWSSQSQKLRSISFSWINATLYQILKKAALVICLHVSCAVLLAVLLAFPIDRLLFVTWDLFVLHKIAFWGPRDVRLDSWASWAVIVVHSRYAMPKGWESSCILHRTHEIGCLPSIERKEAQKEWGVQGRGREEAERGRRGGFKEPQMTGNTFSVRRWLVLCSWSSDSSRNEVSRKRIVDP